MSLKRRGMPGGRAAGAPCTQRYEEIQIQTGGNDASLETGGISLNMINLLNSNVVLDREARQNVSSANQVFEVLAPRIARVGVRITF